MYEETLDFQSALATVAGKSFNDKIYSNWKKKQVFTIAKFEFMVKVHYGLWANAPSCDPLRE